MPRRKKSETIHVKEGTDLSSPVALLDLLKDAILNRPVDREEVGEALRQILKQYEQQNRVFLIAAANAELPRIVRLMSFLHMCEGELFTEKRIAHSSTKELARMYALAQANMLTGLDNVKKVADMRLEALKAAGGVAGAEKLFSIGKDDELNALAGLPSLDAQSRDRVRKLVTGLVEAIEKDDSVELGDDDDESSTHDSNS